MFPRIKKQLNVESETREISKRRRGTTGVIRFKQSGIPERWKFETEKLWESIHVSVAHCHYDDPFKRERLENAVFEVLSGQNTMKGAATAYMVPFTTLQTYFHRSRARMVKIMNDNNDAPPEQIYIPISLTLSPHDMDNALTKEKMSVVESKKSKRLDSLLDVLMAKVMESDVWVNGSLPHSDFVPQKLGSSKRKPKEVHRIMQAPTTENEIPEDCESPNWFNEQDMCDFSNLDPASAKFSVYPVEEILENPDKNEIDFEKADENKDHALSLLSEFQNYEYYDKIKKEIHGKYSVIGAASTMELPTSALHSYTQAALMTFLQRQADLEALNRKDREVAADECVVLSNPISKEVETVISDLMKTSAHDLNEQQKLRGALFEVLMKGVPITEVSSKYGIAVSAFQPYITKARVLLGQSPYPTSSNIKKKKADAKLSDGNEKCADEETTVNKILTNTEPSQGDIYSGDTISAATHPNITKGFSKHGKQCDVGNLLTKLCESTNDSLYLLSSTVVDLYSNNNEFDDANYIESKIAKIRPKCDKQVKSMSATNAEEIEPSTRSTVLCPENEDDYSGDEYNGLPRSIRGVVKLISNRKLDKLDVKEYTGTPENLAAKIDKALRQYNFRGDREKMRDAILEVLNNSKTLSEACRGTNLAATTLSTYVRLVKVVINAEKAQKLLTRSTDPAKEHTKVHGKLVQNVDVMMLHTQPIINDVESFYKVLISYLIEQQYRRSEEAQQKMCASLEYVLLDGLSVTEALQIHEGPTKHVLQIYLSRCRQVNRCITTEFPNFKLSVAQAISKNYASDKQDIEDDVPVICSNTNEVTTNSSIKRSSKRVQKMENNDSSEWTVGSLKHLNLIFSEDFCSALYDYLGKLNRVNFPIKDSLIVGLAKMIIDELPMNEQIFFADTVWDQWLINYREKHPELEE